MCILSLWFQPTLDHSHRPLVLLPPFPLSVPRNILQDASSQRRSVSTSAPIADPRPPVPCPNDELVL